MIDFIYRLNDVLPNWPLEEKWTLQKISTATDTSIPHVLQYLSDGLSKELDIGGAISLDEATEAIVLLSRRLRPQIEERERQLAIRRRKAQEVAEKTLGKIYVMEIKHDLHMAFKTLCYVIGLYEADLPKQEMINLCNEAVRIGIKAGTNFQELSRWLEKAVAAALSMQTKAGIEEALDLLDAYSEYFLAEDTGKGPMLVGNILAAIEEPAARFELWEEYKSLVGQVYP